MPNPASATYTSAAHKPAAAAWCAYENACSRLIPAGRGRNETADPFYSGALAMARIEAHYMINRGFLAPGALLAGMTALQFPQSAAVALAHAGAVALFLAAASVFLARGS